MKSNLDGESKTKIGFYLVTNEETAETYADPSLKAAADALGMTTPGLVYRIESANWPDWVYQ